MNTENTALTKTTGKSKPRAPAFVEAEKMLDRMATVTEEIGQKAFEFFVARGHDLGPHFDDWLKAEQEILRPVPVEVKESKDGISVRAAVPGFKPDEIEVSVKDNILFLSGETCSEEKKEDERTFYSEWRSNRFCRQLILPFDVEPGSVDAKLNEGVLYLTLKKMAEQPAEKILVKSA